jgi:hypothetical protein
MKLNIYIEKKKINDFFKSVMHRTQVGPQQNSDGVHLFLFRFFPVQLKTFQFDKCLNRT